MANKRISQLTTTITAFRTGDVIPVDGPSGTAKMPKDDLLRIINDFCFIENITVSLCATFSTSNNYGIGDFVQKDGRLYRFTSDHPAGAWTGTDVAGTSVNYLKNHVFDAICPKFDVATKYTKNKLVVYNNEIYRFTSDHPAGAWVGTDVTKISVADLLESASANDVFSQSQHLYVGAGGKLYIEESKVASGSVYIKAVGNNWVARNDYRNLNFTLSNSDFAARLGTTTTTSPLGVTDCIEIKHTESLCIDTTIVDFAIRAFSAQTKFTIPILSCVGGYVKGINLNILGGLQAIANSGAIVDADCKQQLYVGANGRMYVEESFVATDGIYLKAVGDDWVARNYLVFQRNNSSMASYLGVSLTASTKGVPDCIKIPHLNCLVLNTADQALKIIPRDQIGVFDTPLISAFNGRVVGVNAKVFANSFISNAIESGKCQQIFFDGNSWKTKAKTIASSILTASGGCDSFILFSDPHVYDDNDFVLNFRKIMDEIKIWSMSVPVNFVMSGGDWLTSGATQEEAVFALGYISKWCYENFGEEFVSALGNHDTNESGVVSDVDTSQGTLSQSVINEAFFSYNGKKSYYSKSTNDTRVFTFDSGEEGIETLTTYMKEQMDWFAGELKSNEIGHIVLFIHEGFKAGTGIYAFAQEILDCAKAFNERGTYTSPNSENFDFSGAQGYVECMLCGHIHTDYSDYIYDIPVASVIRAGTGGCSFDIGVLDYTNNKLKLNRIGSGSDRTLNLFSSTL